MSIRFENTKPRKSWDIYELEDLKVNFVSGNSRLQQQVFQVDLLSIIAEGFSEIAEYKDNETGLHIKRISKMTEIIANDLFINAPYLGITSDFVRILRISSPLHDIGKVMVPDAILNKPGKLSPEEFEVIKKHPIVGWRILKNLHHKISFYGINYFEFASKIAKEHHERFDGKGYPDGLKGTEISVEAQITSIVDVYDALRSRRPYKEPFTNEKTLEIIGEEFGKQFHPDMVNAMIRRQNELDHIFNLFDYGEH